MIAVSSRQPDRCAPPRSAGRPLTVSIHLAISALVLTTILLTAAASSLLWWRTAEATSRQLASTINEQIVAAVRKEVSAIVGEARAAHTAIRTLFLQNVLDAREADKREFVFLSQLQSHATISWVAFGWPNGSFFAAHKLGDGHLEMMEISLTDHPGQRRIDEYAVIPGDIEFEQRQFVPTDFRVVDQAWFKTGMGAEGPQWFKVLDHPIGQRPSIAFAGPIDVYQERQGVLGADRGTGQGGQRVASGSQPGSAAAAGPHGPGPGRQRGPQGGVASSTLIARRGLRGRAHAVAVSRLVAGDRHSRSRVPGTSRNHAAQIDHRPCRRRAVGGPAVGHAGAIGDRRSAGPCRRRNPACREF